MLNTNPLKTLVIFAACFILAGCGTTSESGSSQPEQQLDRSSKIDAALERAALTAAARGEKGQSFAYLEKIYKRKSDDPQAAINYAAALREADYINRAAIVLAPFANDANSPSAAKSEFAAIHLAQGKYDEAEKYAQKAILQNENNYEAYHYLGIALDAKSMHKEAERAFRRGLDYWQGDPTAIMNNLALNLASQGHLTEAAEILHKAQAFAPDRLEIERNLRIVTALQQSNGYKVPKPSLKPDIKE